MNIRNTRALKDTALLRLGDAREPQKIVLAYGIITVLTAVLVTVVNYCLDLQVSQTSGLGSLGIRSFLSTVQTVLPIVQTLFLMCLDLGYMAAMLHICRRQNASPETMKIGFARFWPLLRCVLLQFAIYIGLSILCFYLALMVFLLTPLSNGAMEILRPLVTSSSVLNTGTLLLDEATELALASAMAPMFAVFGIAFTVVCAPFFYKYRMANYVLLDQPKPGALSALRESRQMMKGSRVSLFRLDLSFWWYYLLLAASMVVCYGDLLLPMLGVEFPWSGTVSYFLFYGLFLAIELVIYYFARNRVEATYALAYESLRPRPQQSDGGVVLGNIFDM